MNIKSSYEIYINKNCKEINNLNNSYMIQKILKLSQQTIINHTKFYATKTAILKKEIQIKKIIKTNSDQEQIEKKFQYMLFF